MCNTLLYSVCSLHEHLLLFLLYVLLCIRESVHPLHILVYITFYIRRSPFRAITAYTSQVTTNGDADDIFSKHLTNALHATREALLAGKIRVTHSKICINAGKYNVR